MIYNYEILNNGEEDILYLYLNMTYEFSKELGRKATSDDLAQRTKNFIVNNNIKFDGKKVYIIMDGIVVRTVDIKDKVLIQRKDNKVDYSNSNFLVNVKLLDDSIIELELGNFLVNILAYFFSLNLEKETLKATCILFRTYAYKMMKENGLINLAELFIYEPIENYLSAWDKKYLKIVNYLKDIVNSTDEIFLLFNNDYILPFIHYSNMGWTFSSSKYSYLTSVESLWDICSPYYVEKKIYLYKDLFNILKLEKTNKFIFQIIEKDEYNQVIKLKINNKIFSEEEIRKMFNLKSLHLSFIINKNNFVIISRGYGNFLGLSLYGANELAKNECNFITILNYYFPKCAIFKYKKAYYT